MTPIKRKQADYEGQPSRPTKKSRSENKTSELNEFENKTSELNEFEKIKSITLKINGIYNSKIGNESDPNSRIAEILNDYSMTAERYELLSTWCALNGSVCDYMEKEKKESTSSLTEINKHREVLAKGLKIPVFDQVDPSKIINAYDASKHGSTVELMLGVFNNFLTSDRKGIYGDYPITKEESQNLIRRMDGHQSTYPDHLSISSFQKHCGLYFNRYNPPAPGEKEDDTLDSNTYPLVGGVKTDGSICINICYTAGGGHYSAVEIPANENPQNITKSTKKLETRGDGHCFFRSVMYGLDAYVQYHCKDKENDKAFWADFERQHRVLCSFYKSYILDKLTPEEILDPRNSNNSASVSGLDTIKDSGTPIEAAVSKLREIMADGIEADRDITDATFEEHARTQMI